MSKEKNGKASVSNRNLNIEDLITSYPVKRTIMLCIVLSVLLAVAVLSFIYKEYICSIGIIAFVIYIITMTFGQKADNYRFEFKKDSGLSGFKVFYKGKELKLDYKLDKHGKFMWGDVKKEANCIGYADGSKMNKYIIRYRILNYLNVFLEQNDLKSDHAW